MKKLMIPFAILAVACGPARNASKDATTEGAALSGPAVSVTALPEASGTAGTTAIVAHRGFWDCDAAGFSENSIASLKAAQDNGFWGSEFDIQLTSDDVVIVNHDNSIDGLRIATHTWSELEGHLLPNGERRPLLEEYIQQGTKSGTVMVCEFKKQPTEEKEDILVDKTIEALKRYGMYSPDRVAFISFSMHVCERIAEIAPEFVNEYLNGDLDPETLMAKGINGWDYHQSVVRSHPRWVDMAHSLGMKTNVWTVNKEKDIVEMAGLGVDAITSNDPLLVRSILKDREIR